MIISGMKYNTTDRTGRGKGSMPDHIFGEGGSGEYFRRENDFFSQVLGVCGGEQKGRAGKIPGRESGEKGPGNVSPEEEFSKNQGVGRLISAASRDGEQLNREELLKLLADHREEILKKVKSGETGVKIPIGSMLLTQEEWEKLLDSFDEAQEKIQEEIREENSGTLPEKKPDTTVNGDKVFDPEETGHDLKPLEELIGETNVKGKTADDPDEGDLRADDKEEREA